MGRRTKGKGWQLYTARGAGSPASRRSQSAAPESQTIKVKEENRGKGKRVTVARGFQLTEADLKTLGKSLKAGCGAGGKADGEAIEIQGSQTEKLKELLAAEGYKIA